MVNGATVGGLLAIEELRLELLKVAAGSGMISAVDDAEEVVTKLEAVVLREEVRRELQIGTGGTG